MKRRTLLQHAMLGLLLPLGARAAARTRVEVYKTPTCGCCHEWVAHLEKNGFEVVTHDVQSTAPWRARFGVPQELGSCHTAVVEGYALEGHVPAEDVRRLLAERPKARGLAVPGMPAGSPGMENGGTRRDAFDVVLFADDGVRKVYRRYPAGA